MCLCKYVKVYMNICMTVCIQAFIPQHILYSKKASQTSLTPNIKQIRFTSFRICWKIIKAKLKTHNIRTDKQSKI